MIFQTKLANGITVVGQHMPFFRSFSLGVWLGTGSVKEKEGEAGITHLIEHMLFKGTPSISAEQIAAEMDNIGAQINAFTAKECTCYYIRATDQHLEKAVSMLGDIVLHSSIDGEELEKEKGVVLEEILMVEDTPEDLVTDLISQTYFAGHQIGKPILGTAESVRQTSREKIFSYMDEHYNGEDMLISIAGNFDQEKLISYVEKYFADAEKGSTSPYPAAPALAKKSINFKQKPIEQAHICFAMPGYKSDDPLFYQLMVLNNALGGNMSSRLFQKIREQLGLAYSVYSYTSSYKHTGTMCIYAGTNCNNALQVSGLMLDEMRNLKKSGMSKEEFIRSKNQLHGSYILSSESTGSRMSSIGRSLLVNGVIKTEEEIISNIEKVTLESVNDIMGYIFDEDHLCAALVGNVESQMKAIEALW